MKILQVHTSYREAGGEDAVVAADATLLRGAGHTVVQHVAANPESTVAAAAALARAPWNTAAAREITRAVARERPDVAHVHNTWFALSPSIVTALARAGVPVVMTLHNYRLLCSNALLFRDGRPCEDCVGSHPWHGVVHRCYRGSVVASAAAATTIAVNRGTWTRHVSQFLTLNAFARERFIAGGLPADRLVVSGNFVGDPGPRLAPPSQSRTVLYVGRLTPEKGIGALVDAWAAAGPEDMELLVVGDGPLREELQRRSVPGVRIAGWRPPDEVVTSMRGSRALLFPSQWYEGQPVTLLEALAAGLPVMASDMGGTAELLGDSGRAWLVSGVDGWPEALARLQRDEELDQHGAALRRRYEASYTPASALRRLEDVYASARRHGS